MLNKLLKYEWKDTRRLLLPMNLVIILLTIIGCILLSTSMFGSYMGAYSADILNINIGFFLAGPLLILYALSIIAFSFITLIYIYVRFYKNLFAAEGYLMHTLPVTRTQLFHSKLIVGHFWFFLNSILTALSTAALGFTAGFHEAGTEMANEINVSFDEFFGCPIPVLLLWILATLITSSLSSVLMGYFSVLLGQLMERNKLAAAVAFYFGIYMVIQTVSSLAMLIPTILELEAGLNQEVIFTFERYNLHLIFQSMSIFYLFLSIAFYAACRILINRKVNLD